VKKWMLLPGLVLALGCDDEEVAVRAQALLEATPRALDFGTVDVTQEGLRTLELRNFGTRAATLQLDIEDDCSGCFALRTELPEGIGSGQTITLDFAFRPVEVGVATATLTFTSPQDEVQPIAVSAIGEGRDGRRPDIEVDPSMVDFGGAVVPVGQPAFDRLRIFSAGDADLLIDRIALEPFDGPFSITTSTGTSREPARLVPGDDIELSVRALLPEGDTSTRTARIIIDTNVDVVKNVPGAPGRVEVPITAGGNQVPVAVLNAPEFVEPFSRVEFDGMDSFDPDEPPDLPLATRWTLLDAPSGSQARLQSRSAESSAFFADLTGQYRLELAVTDALGLTGRTTQIIEARPDEGIRIELLWDHPDSDVDLHFIRDGGEFCDCGADAPGAPSDVHYRCLQADWYPENPGANPVLDVDDEQGFGPEVILMEGEGDEKFIPADRFRIEVHYFNDKDEISDFPTTVSNATVRVFLSGRKVAEYDRALAETGVRWVVAEIDWPSAELTEIDQAFDGFGCGIF